MRTPTRFGPLDWPEPLSRRAPTSGVFFSSSACLIFTTVSCSSRVARSSVILRRTSPSHLASSFALSANWRLRLSMFFWRSASFFSCSVRACGRTGGRERDHAEGSGANAQFAEASLP